MAWLAWALSLGASWQFDEEFASTVEAANSDPACSQFQKANARSLASRPKESDSIVPHRELNAELPNELLDAEACVNIKFAHSSMPALRFQ